MHNNMTPMMEEESGHTVPPFAGKTTTTSSSSSSSSNDDNDNDNDNVDDAFSEAAFSDAFHPGDMIDVTGPRIASRIVGMTASVDGTMGVGGMGGGMGRMVLDDYDDASTFDRILRVDVVDDDDEDD